MSRMLGNLALPLLSILRQAVRRGKGARKSTVGIHLLHGMAQVPLEAAPRWLALKDNIAPLSFAGETGRCLRQLARKDPQHC